MKTAINIYRDFEWKIGRNFSKQFPVNAYSTELWPSNKMARKIYQICQS